MSGMCLSMKRYHTLEIFYPIIRRISNQSKFTRRMSPSARHIVMSKGIDDALLSGIGTGKCGMIKKCDVIFALQKSNVIGVDKNVAKYSLPLDNMVNSPLSPPNTDNSLNNVCFQPQVTITAASGIFKDTTHTNVRKVIAKRLANSKNNSPHAYSKINLDIDALLSLRKKLSRDHNIMISVNDIILRCASLSLRDVPEVNISYNPEVGICISSGDSIDISIAVATSTGLITPILRNVHTLGLADISSNVYKLSSRAKNGSLTPSEYQGGTFCVSNLGMFGIREFGAIINPPHTSILSIGNSVRIFNPCNYVRENEGVLLKPDIKTTMIAMLSFDRRFVDETIAALFLRTFSHYISSPFCLLS